MRTPRQAFAAGLLGLFLLWAPSSYGQIRATLGEPQPVVTSLRAGGPVEPAKPSAVPLIDLTHLTPHAPTPRRRPATSLWPTLEPKSRACSASHACVAAEPRQVCGARETIGRPAGMSWPNLRSRFEPSK